MQLIERFTRIEQKRAVLLDELSSLGPDRLAAHPVPGKWSILENVEHMVLAEEDVVGDFAALDELPERSRRLQNRGLRIVVMFILRFGIPVRAPSRAMLPTGERTLDELRPAWEDNHRRLRAFLAGLDRAGANRAIFRHPVCGPLTVVQGIRMMDVHLARHTGQIGRLLRLPG
jgi:uncharacterized damage-inducible protein DinB